MAKTLMFKSCIARENLSDPDARFSNAPSDAGQRILGPLFLVGITLN